MLTRIVDCNTCPEIREYFDYVKHNPGRVCEEQRLFVDLVERTFWDEELYIDLEQLAGYMKNQKYFPFKLFAWEKCLFTLHNCVYTSGGEPRWPTLRIFVGRGTGKNGYLAFEDFCLLTPINGIRNYHIDIYATCEDQAKQTFTDLYNILEEKEDFFKNYFYWNKEVIRNLKTGSELRYHTRAPGSKDGKRPGKNDYDEVHAYENYALIDTTQTGLGKVRHPRETFISSNGDVRDGPLDDFVNDGEDILNGVVPDNGTLPFFCWVESDEEIKDEECWYKANPSLHEFQTLLRQIRKEFNDYIKDPYKHLSFASKRMNRPLRTTADAICAWNDLLEASGDWETAGKTDTVVGIDFVLVNDFAAAGFLGRTEDGGYFWDTHSWVCKNSADLPRIKYDVKAAEKQGLLTIVDAVEISEDIILEWVAKTATEKQYNVKCICVDTFRYSVLKTALTNMGFSADKGSRNIFLTRTSDLMKIAPMLLSVITTHKLHFGKNNSLMRWYCWNVKKIIKNGNVFFEKQDYKKRKTDGFYALAHAFTKSDMIQTTTRKSVPRIGVIRRKG